MAQIKSLLLFLSLSVILGCKDSKEKKESPNKVTTNLVSSVPYFKTKTVFLLKDRVIIANTYSSLSPQKETDTVTIPYFYSLPKGQTVSQLIYFLTIPLGKQYQVNYSDQAQYWFNSGTVLSFSVKNDVAPRLVPVRLYTGETFIHLSHKDSLNLQTDHFVVKAEAGSSLNIKNYIDESSEDASVFSGRGTIIYSGEEKKLKQGEEVSFIKDSKTLKKQDFEPELAASWTTGWIRTKNTGEFFRQIARWFDRQVIYEGVDPEAMGGDMNFNIQSFKLQSYFKVLSQGFQINCTERDGKIYVYKSAFSKK